VGIKNTDEGQYALEPARKLREDDDRSHNRDMISWCGLRLPAVGSFSGKLNVA
jgi:hypothetical protein